MEYFNNISERYSELYKKYRAIFIIVYLIIFIRIYILLYIKEDSNSLRFSSYIGQETKLNNIEYSNFSYLLHKKYIDHKDYYKHIVLYNKEKKKFSFNNKIKIGDILIEGNNKFTFFRSTEEILSNTLIKSIGLVIGFKLVLGNKSIKDNYLECYPIILSNNIQDNKYNEIELNLEWMKKYEPNYYIFRHININDKLRKKLIKYNNLFKDRLYIDNFLNLYLISFKKHYCELNQKIFNTHSIDYIKSCNKWYLNNSDITNYDKIIKLIKKNEALNDLINNDNNLDNDSIELLKNNYNKNVKKIKQFKNTIKFTCNQYIYFLYYLINIDIFREERENLDLNISDFSYFINASLIEKKVVGYDFIFITNIHIKEQEKSYFYIYLFIFLVLSVLLYKKSEMFRNQINYIINYISSLFNNEDDY